MVPTIKSRCRMFTFQPPSMDIFKDLVQRESSELSQDDMTTLYDMTHGSVGQALEIEEEGGLESVINVMGLLSDWPNWNWPVIHGMADTMARKGQENSFRVFHNVLLWIYESILCSKASEQNLPSLLQNEAILALRDHYSLVEWIDICQNTKDHFEAVSVSNLDKKQAVLGAFTLLPEKKAA